jgi:hypothetical protein
MMVKTLNLKKNVRRWKKIFERGQKNVRALSSSVVKKIFFLTAGEGACEAAR